MWHLLKVEGITHVSITANTTPMVTFLSSIFKLNARIISIHKSHCILNFAILNLNFFWQISETFPSCCYGKHLVGIWTATHSNHVQMKLFYFCLYINFFCGGILARYSSFVKWMAGSYISRTRNSKIPVLPIPAWSCHNNQCRVLSTFFNWLCNLSGSSLVYASPYLLTILLFYCPSNSQS